MPQVKRKLESNYAFGVFSKHFDTLLNVKSSTFEISRVQMKRDQTIKANVVFFLCNVLSERMHPWAEFISAADLFSPWFCH